MTRGACYVENDSFAAEWLRQLIAGGHIADGEVYECSIEDVAPVDLRGFTQVHLCAGIAVWSLALRHAGWTDDRPCLTVSFPCQPFSAAGKGAGFADDRHIWPAGFWLIRQLEFECIFGEQVEGPAGAHWFDSVSADLEGEGYACGQVVFPAAGVGAPHIRSRRYWMAHHGREQSPAGAYESRRRYATSQSERLGDAVVLGHHRHQGLAFGSEPSDLSRTLRHEGSAAGEAGAVRDGLADEPLIGRGEERQVAGGLAERDRAQGRTAGHVPGGDVVRTLVDTESEQAGIPGRSRQSGGSGGDGLGDTGGNAGAEGLQRSGQYGQQSQDGGAGRSAVGESWRDPDWIYCRDGKYRPVEPGSFPLAHGAPARVGRLRGYGNGLCKDQAQVFIEEAMTWLLCGDLVA